ncbi:MAG TPA: hypothetical protein VGK60_07955, partial [Pedococcus sp.]
MVVVWLGHVCPATFSRALTVEGSVLAMCRDQGVSPGKPTMSNDSEPTVTELLAACEGSRSDARDHSPNGPPPTAVVVRVSPSSVCLA